MMAILGSSAFLPLLWSEPAHAAPPAGFSDKLVVDGLNLPVAMEFAPDGRLYITTGDNYHPHLAQSLTSRLGKVLRINADGTIPTDNPFYRTSGAYREIWALGLRNPFTAAMSSDGEMYVNDVGQDTWEEVNVVSRGANFGWPLCEGRCSEPGFEDPVNTYQHPADESGSSIAGGAFYEASQFPSEYRGNYFFGDYVQGFIKRLASDGQLLNNNASAAAVAAEAATVRATLLNGAPDATSPANLNSLVEQSLTSARFSRLDDATRGPRSAVFVTSIVRGAAIQLGLESLTGSNHVGRDELLVGTSAHRVYVLEAYNNRFGASPKKGTYHAFRPNERTPQVGDIIVQDRQVSDINDVVAFDDIPTTLNSGYMLHADIVVEVPDGADYVIAIGGNLSNSARRRRYPLDADRKLVVERTQLYTQENDNGNLPNIPATDNSAGLNSSSTGRIFALLSLVQQCAAIPGQKVDGGVLV
jgi:hypothetical protein